MRRKKQLKVIKADDSVEEYLHTKVIGTVSNALAEACQADISVAEHLSEVVTFYLYNGRNRNTVTSSEIFSIIKAVLTATNYGQAAIILSQYHFERKLRRSRTEVISVDVQQLSDAELLCDNHYTDQRSRWNKSIMVADLVTKYGLCRHTARTIASMVEEKIFNLGITQVPASLIKQLLLCDTAAVMRADRQLQTV